MTDFSYNEETQTFAFKVEDTALLKFPDSVLEKCGKLFVDAMRRRRNNLLCERYGHEWDEVPVEAGFTHLCRRCKTTKKEAVPA